MYLKVVKGLDEARRGLHRLDPTATDSLPADVLDRTETVFGERLSPQESVQRILNDVRQRGDEAVRHYARLLDGLDLQELEVTQEEVAKATELVEPELLDALKLAAERVERFHRSTMPEDWIDGPSGLGELIRPLERVGVYAPGGTASYPSTVLMTAIPARVAGVSEVFLATPPRGGQTPEPTLLAAASISGVDRVFRVGGVQAIAAMAFGTETIPKVDKVCGPGNLFVTLAKRMVFGDVDIDGLYGPTETVIVTDDTANPAYCAADLLAQAEHDQLASAILVTTSPQLVEAVEAELERQMSSLERSALAGVSLENQGMVILLDSLDDALVLANEMAPEHLCLMVKEPWGWADKVKHAGGLFLGPFSPEVMGDYVAGPSHVMPTGGTARFRSALSVHQFLRTMPVVGLKPEGYGPLAEAAARIARAEGLSGHARAVETRIADLPAHGALSPGRTGSAS